MNVSSEKEVMAMVNMPLHAVKNIPHIDGHITRVPGGWIYTLLDTVENTRTNTFVPMIDINNRITY